MSRDKRAIFAFYGEEGSLGFAVKVKPRYVVLGILIPAILLHASHNHIDQRYLSFDPESFLVTFAVLFAVFFVILLLRRKATR